MRFQKVRNASYLLAKGHVLWGALALAAEGMVFYLALAARAYLLFDSLWTAVK